MRAMLALSSIVLATGCFRVHPADGTVRCAEPPARACPEGYTCTLDHHCYRRGVALPVGQACASADTCPTGYCVDGVCCDDACDATCRTCKAAGSEGHCTSIPVGADPDYECGPTGTAGIPAEELDKVNTGTCGGSCNGQGACSYAAATTACGALVCADPGTQRSYTCDGTGSCVGSSAACNHFVCDAGACKNTCSALSDCQTTDYCNVTTNACVPKKSAGLPCALDFECAQGHCTNPVNGAVKLCCATACSDTGMSCDVPGSEGTCSCGSITCASGCQLYYRDADGDGHGDETGTLGNGRAIGGCVGTPSISSGSFNWYPDDLANKRHLDCDDNDSETFYGQTQGFDHVRAHPTGPQYDFDCDGADTKTLPEYNHGCYACTYYATVGPCQAGQTPCCVDNGGLCSTNPAVAGTAMSGFTCAFNGGGVCSGEFVRSAFTGPVACGIAGGTVGGTWTTCGMCDTSAGGAPAKTTDPTKKQACR